MFKKVHIKLTLLCAGITAIIMITMSLCYLYVSETGLYKNHYQSFQSDINTITTNLEQQSVISMEWLSKMEAQGKYLFYVLDNGIPFLYNQLNEPEENPKRALLLEESLDAYQESGWNSPTNTVSAFTSYHFEFEFTSASCDSKFFGSVIRMGKSSSTLEVIVLSSLESLELQIREQRVRFVLIDIAAILLLGIFSWIFTGKLLRPIMENQEDRKSVV